MADHAPVAEMLEIAASGALLLDRARAVVERLDDWLPVDAIWLALSDPGSRVYATVGSQGLEQQVLDYLERPEVAREIKLAGLDQERAPISATELPVPVADRPTWADCLIPAGFREGLGVPLCEPGGPYVGMLSLLFANGEPPSGALRDCIGRLAPLIARGVSPMRSLIGTARIVVGASSGAVLLRQGGSCTLPGLSSHPLLDRDSQVADVARQMLLGGHVYRSFLWPQVDSAGATEHARVTVLSASDAPDFLLGTLLITPHAHCDLTSRELEVLGLLIDGRSNREIARRLFVSTRTVATHVEHILHKLEAPTRTLAAIRAEREGWYVPSPCR